MTEQNKHSYFKQIAGKRVERILEALDALGNCSSPATYAYDNQELPSIFAAITEKLMETRQRLIAHSPYNGIPFRLQPPDSLELDGCKISRRQLAGMDVKSQSLQTLIAWPPRFFRITTRLDLENSNCICEALYRLSNSTRVKMYDLSVSLTSIKI